MFYKCVVFRQVAVKVVEKARLDAKSLQRTYREIAILKTLRHPHLLTLYQVRIELVSFIVAVAACLHTTSRCLHTQNAIGTPVFMQLTRV